MNCIKQFWKFSLIGMAANFGCLQSPGATNDATNAVDALPSSISPVTSRDFYNAGTRKLEEGKLNNAESLLRSALSGQDANIQPATLYNLGYVRFGQGMEELKKGPAPAAVASRAEAIARKGAQAMRDAGSALAGDDLEKMVEAYMAGRGVRKEAREAVNAFRNAMDVYAKTLLKWQRSLGDFKSAVELNPADTNAAYNAEIVERAIAKLVDSIRKMQQGMMPMVGRKPGLSDMLNELKGRIPKDMMPPGAEGDEEDEDFPVEALRGLKEGPSKDGEQLEWMLSPEQAADLLKGLRLGEGQSSPLGRGESGPAKERRGRDW